MGKEKKSCCSIVLVSTLIIAAAVLIAGYVFRDDLFPKEDIPLKCFVCTSSNLQNAVLLNGQKARAVHYSTRREASQGGFLENDQCYNDPKTIQICEKGQYCSALVKNVGDVFQVTRQCHDAKEKLGCGRADKKGVKIMGCFCNQDYCFQKPVFPES